MPNRIVFLDGYTLSRAVPGQPASLGEPAWDTIGALGDLTVYDRTGSSDVLDRAGNAPILLTNKTPLPAEVISALPGGVAPETAEEKAWHKAARKTWRAENAYFLVQATKPQTLSYAMMDSPVGIAAWIVEKFDT